MQRGDHMVIDVPAAVPRIQNRQHEGQDRQEHQTESRRPFPNARAIAILVLVHGRRMVGGAPCLLALRGGRILVQS